MGGGGSLRDTPPRLAGAYSHRCSSSMGAHEIWGQSLSIAPRCDTEVGKHLAGDADPVPSLLDQGQWGPFVLTQRPAVAPLAEGLAGVLDAFGGAAYELRGLGDLG